MELHEPNLWAYWCHAITLLLFMNLFPPATTLVKGLGNETDRFALLKFKEAIAIDPYGLLNSWNDSFHLCSWQGITCGRHQRVTALNLQDYALLGTLSPFIGNLTFLRFFNIENNSFSGKIPQQVDHLFRLRHLNLSVNMLEGEIPVLNHTCCPELSIISLEFNRLIGKIPPELDSLMKLVALNLESNNLTGGIPPSLGNLSSIRQLSFTQNNLVGNVPEEMGRSQSFSIFAIGFNNLSGTIPPSLFNMSSMEVMFLSSNKFKGNIPPTIGLNKPSLQRIYLNGNEFSGQIPSSISNASQLELLYINKNNFAGQVPKFFGNLQHLSRLVLSKNKLGSFSANDLNFITSLTNCSKLEILGLDNNNFGGVLPNSVGNFSTQLTSLYLGYNQISGTLPVTLANLNNLILLNMDSNLFTGVIPTFGKFQKLQALSLQDNRLSGQIPSSIGSLSQLFALYLTGNELEGSIPPSIENCRYLQEIGISQNRFSGVIPTQLIGLSSLLYVNLSQNSLTGSLPMKVSKNINRLDISENNLTGAIPETIGECVTLEILYLQGNLFQGIIPSSLASLRGLEYLDLSRNNLSGQIPKDLQRLLFLLHLNLSFNNLEGEVPKEGVFRNTSAISLVGNTKLCGGMSEMQLPACPIKVPKHRMIHGFKLKLAISLVVGCSLLFAIFFALFWRRKQKRKPLSAADSSINFLSKVPYQTLHQVTDGFSLINLIGSGGFGSVFKGILDQEENNIVAIKVLNLQQKGASKSFLAECNALRNIRHRNLVKILTCCSSMDHNGNDFKALVFEYMPNGSLEEWLHGEKSKNQSRSLNLVQRLNIALDVASALCYLHDHCEPQVIHCDIKPSNVLLDDDMVARVGDFGLARLISMTMDSSQNQSSTGGIRGTIGYAAPEYAVGVEPSRQGDVYSYGILVLQIFTGRRPTDEMFKDGFNLYNFVKMAIPGRLMQIMDPTLLATLEETTPAISKNEVNYISGYNNEIEADEENMDCETLKTMNTCVWKCILPILKIGLACSEASPKNRMSMEDVVMDLHHIHNAFIALKAR